MLCCQHHVQWCLAQPLSHLLAPGTLPHYSLQAAGPLQQFMLQVIKYVECN